MTENELKEFSDVKLAIVKIEKILEIVVIDLKDRVRILEKHDEEFQKVIYQSCDNMTNQVDTKVAEAKRFSSSYIKDTKTLVLGIIGGIIMLGIIAIVYFEKRINAIDVKNGVILEKLQNMDKKLDRATAQRYHIKDNIISEAKR